MRPRLSQGYISPKISTMPRQKTEAAAYLEIYKLVNEKKRLQQELETLEQRRDRIQKRLEVLEVEISAQQASADQLRDQPAAAQPVKPTRQLPSTSSGDLNTFFLEY